MMQSGAVRNRVALLLAVLPLLLSGCLYGFSGGGGLPRNLRTVAVQPFDNQTASADVQRDLLEGTRKGLRERLSLREASEQKASVLVSGVITRYDVDLPAGVSADPRQTTSTRRRLQLTVDIEIIDQTTGRSLFKRQGLTAEAQYPEGGEVEGRKTAIESFVTQVVEGMQSQW